MTSSIRSGTVAVIIVCVILTWPVHRGLAQEAAPAPWVLVVPAANETGDPTLDPIGSNVAQTISLTLRLLGDFEVRELPPEAIPGDVIAGNPAALRRFADRQTMDYIVFGDVVTAGTGIDISAAVWDRGQDRVTVTERSTADSLFDTFNVADELAQRFLTAFSGQRIAFGSIRIQRDGWPGGSYTVHIDNQNVGHNVTAVGNVLVGSRRVTILADNGDRAGETLLDEAVTVTEGGTSAVSFTMAAPAPVAPSPAVQEAPSSDTKVAAAGKQPTRDDEEVPEPTNGKRRSEPESATETSPTTPRTPGEQRVALGVSLLYWVNDIGREGSPRPGVSVWADVDLLSGLQLSAQFLGAPEPSATYDTLDGSSVLSNPDSYVPEAEAAVGGDVSVGWRLIQRPFAGGRLDLAPFGALGYRYQWYFLRYGAGTAAEGSVVDAAFSADPEWINQQYMTLSAGVRVRTIWDRLVLRASFQIARNVDIATPANGRELYLLNAATGEFEPTGASVEGIPETGITWNTTLGVGVRF